MTQPYQQNTINQEPGAQLDIVTTGLAEQTLTTGGLVTADVTGGNLTLTLPLAADAPAATLTVQKIDGTGNTVAFLAQGSDTINGAAADLTAQYDTAQFQSDGVSFWVQIV